LPIAFPLLDLEDRAVIGITDVWGNFSDIIREASQRYSVDAILVARLHKENNAWQGRWTIYHDGLSRNWQSAQLELEDLLQEQNQNANFCSLFHKYQVGIFV